jgi:RNA polymerase sigma-70 factor, ECF subfamily
VSVVATTAETHEARADRLLVTALRRGDEKAFAELVDRYQGPLIRLAMVYVRNRAVAEEVVQDTWVAVLGGLERFEGRSLLRTWIFRILVNRAKTRAVREARTTPFSPLEPDDGDDFAAVPAERFLDAAHPVWPGHWASPPNSWDGVPERRVLDAETLELVRAAIAELPPAQARVITLRDVEGWDSAEVCELLGVSEGNQRVLLHRARSKVRAALERHLDG